MQQQRCDLRPTNQLRTIKMTRQFTKHAEGSVLVEFGDTKVICTASVSPGVPSFLKDSGRGWVTAEYGMLPRSTHDRMQREASKGKQTGRTQEIQRLIARSLRAAVDMHAMGENTIMIDCDVIQADGGTRTASITGGCVALYDALLFLRKKNNLIVNPFKQFVASISVGISQGRSILDLNYMEDAGAETDMNVVMTEHGGFIEVQGNLVRAAVELAKDWRTDRMLRRLEAMLVVADLKSSLIISGNGDVIEPENSLIAIGSGGPYAKSAAKALLDHTNLDAKTIAEQALTIAAEVCIYTNNHFTIETLE